MSINKKFSEPISTQTCGLFFLWRRMSKVSSEQVSTTKKRKTKRPSPTVAKRLANLMHKAGLNTSWSICVETQFKKTCCIVFSTRSSNGASVWMQRLTLAHLHIAHVHDLLWRTSLTLTAFHKASTCLFTDRIFNRCSLLCHNFCVLVHKSTVGEDKHFPSCLER